MALALFSCRQQRYQTQNLENRLDSLELKLANTYKPGLGEFMSGIQVHHNKLWFAGKNENWKLAEFEVAEIRETIDDIRKYCTDRPETNSLNIIDQPLQAVSDAIAQKNPGQFQQSFEGLTVSCNSCHSVTGHAFNVIKVSDTPPFSNQDFSPGE